MEEDVLPLLCDHLLYELGPDMSLQKVRTPHIPHSEEEEQLSIPLRDNCTPTKPNHVLSWQARYLLGKHHSLCPALWS